MSRKALALSELSRNGVRVPRGFCLDDSHYRAAVKPARAALIEAITNGADAHHIFDALKLREATTLAIQEGLVSFSPSSRFAVRSSGSICARGRSIAEDGGDVSLAGQFETFLNVPGEQVVSAVRQCWASLFNKRSIALFGVDADYVDNSTMTVLVQDMVVAAASAVVMTVDPLGDGTVGGIELAVGPCEAIVGGAVNPDEVTFRRTDGAIVERRIGTKAFAFEYRPFARGSENAHMTPVPTSLRERLAVPEDVLVKIVDVARDVERSFRIPQDIELVVDAVGLITVVQARAITRLPAQYVPFGVSMPVAQ